MVKFRSLALSISAIFFSLLLIGGSATAATISQVPPAKKKTSVSDSASTQRRISKLHHRRAVHRRRRHRYYERFDTSSFANDITAGDLTAGEDPVVRAAAVDALGNMNGTVVALDPDTGRILTMVNQKLALSQGAQPCSTIKLAVALAALHEGIIKEDTDIRLGRRWQMNLTQALAHSNNAYFESLGRKLGFERVSYYAHQLGLGELAGYDIEGEHLGEFPIAPPKARDGGVGKMCSFGEGISLTPLQLGALVGALANGGTLFYLQHPETPEEIASFAPHVKRQLDIAPLIPEISDGMAGAVQYGTARSVGYNFSEEQVLGKTGTCSRDHTRFGWFASYANTEHGKIAVVVFLQGGRPTFGPRAAEIAGHLYRNLYDHEFFAEKKPENKASDTTAVGETQ
jgi:cell division protein FtsI/penicillin-binding protein 2